MAQNHRHTLAVGGWAETLLSVPTGDVQLALHLLQINRASGKSDLIPDKQGFRELRFDQIFCVAVVQAPRAVRLLLGPYLGVVLFLDAVRTIPFFVSLSSALLSSVAVNVPLQDLTSHPLQSSITPAWDRPSSCCMASSSLLPSNCLQLVCISTEVWPIQVAHPLLQVRFSQFSSSILNSLPSNCLKKCTADCHELQILRIFTYR